MYRTTTYINHKNNWIVHSMYPKRSFFFVPEQNSIQIYLHRLAPVGIMEKIICPMSKHPITVKIRNAYNEALKYFCYSLYFWNT